MANAQKKNYYYSLEEYEKIIANAKLGERYEYVAGELIILDEYTTGSHNQVVLNTAMQMMKLFYPKGCQVFTENVRLWIEAENSYRLPDVMVTCSERDKTTDNLKRDPVVVAEVLSPSTTFTDLIEKSKIYQQITSLRVYLIINPLKPWVGVCERTAEGEFSKMKEYTLLESKIELPLIGMDVWLQDLYQMVQFS